MTTLGQHGAPSRWECRNNRVGGKNCTLKPLILWGENRQTHIGLFNTGDLPDSRTFHSVIMLSPFFLNTADSCLGLFSQRLIAFLGGKADYKI